MDLEELSLRLGSLERARSEDMQKAAQQAFMDRYGSRISNNKNLGLVILNELDRNNIDTSAADEAVQEILDKLRMEATMLIDTIKDNNDHALELKDKIDTVADAVQVAAEATGADLSMPLGVEPGDAGMPPEASGADMGGAPAPDMPPEASGADMGGAPAPDMPPEASGADMGGAPAPDMPPVPEMPMNTAVSDARLKCIKQIVSDRRAKNVKKNVSNQNTLDYNIISACKGGF